MKKAKTSKKTSKQPHSEKNINKSTTDKQENKKDKKKSQYDILKSIRSDVHVPIHNMQYKSNAPLFCVIYSEYKIINEKVLTKLIRIYTHKKIKNTNNILTCNTSKDSRMSFKMINNDLPEMIDASKVADIVVFVIKSSVGVTKNIEEMASMLKSQGFPKVLVYIENDSCNTDNKNKKFDKEGTKKFKKTFKKIKDRLNILLVEGVKITTDLLKLSRNLTNTKPRPIEWKCANPYIIVDKYEEDNETTDNNFENIKFYGYVRGSTITNNSYVHIPGYGDKQIYDIEILNDPCPIPQGKMLSTKRKKLYNPFIKNEHLRDNKIDDNMFYDNKENEELQLFSDGNKVKKILDYNNCTTEEESDEEIIESLSVEFNNIEESDDADILKDEAMECMRNHDNDYDSVSTSQTSNSDEEITSKDLNNIETNELDKSNITQKNILSDDSTNLIHPGKYILFKLSDAIFNVDKFPKTNVSESDLDSKLKNLKNTLKETIKESLLIIGVVKYNQTQNNTTVRFMRNQYFKKMLKSNDPVIISVGWRRMQILPVYTMSEAINTERNRYVKLAPLGLHCYATFIAPYCSLDTPITFFRADSNFRVAGSGRVVLDDYKKIDKKLKIVGYPKSIKMSSVIVTGMFNTNLEVEKFKDARVLSSSGLRGIVKSPIGDNGDFRCSFEGVIHKNDILFINCWVEFEVINGYVNYEGTEKLRLRKEIYQDERLLEDNSKDSKDNNNNENIEESSIIDESESNTYFENKRKEFDETKLVIPCRLKSKLPFNKMNVVQSNLKNFVPLEQRKFQNKQELMKNIINEERVEVLNKNMKINQEKAIIKENIKKKGIHKNILKKKKYKR